MTPVQASAQPTEAQVDRYRQMRRIREFESRTAVLYRDGEVPGFVHLSVGQEAVAVGVCSQLRDDDIITSTHRGHGHVMAKGLDMTAMFAELMGRATGVCGGFGGSMHIADPALGIYGANGIVGAGLPIAVGAAFAARLRGGDQVVAAFFGDGAVATGAFHESVNLAAPGASRCCSSARTTASPSSAAPRTSIPCRCASGPGLRRHHEIVDGNDVEMTALATANLVARLRRGDGPFLLEAVTRRVRGHYEGDPQSYRATEPGPDGDPAAVDPVERARTFLMARESRPKPSTRPSATRWTGRRGSQGGAVAGSGPGGGTRRCAADRSGIPRA